MTLFSDHDRGTVRLADDQFNKLVELLTPGYELAKAYLDQQQKQAAMRDADQNESNSTLSEGLDAAIKDEIKNAPADIMTGDTGDETT
jgi:hypothetical protein